MKRQLCTLAILTSLCTSAIASAQPRKSGTLPLKNVRLYEAGVGYFERAGRLAANSDAALPVPASHIDDALKTLVVLTQDGTKVGGIEFSSTVSAEMGRALAGLPAGSELTTTYADVLRGLKGSSVEIKLEKETLRGRVLEVVAPDKADADECVAEVRPDDGKRTAGPPADLVPCTPRRHLTMILVTEDSSIRKLRSADLVSVRAIEAGAGSRLGAGLDAASAGSSRAQKSLRVLARGGSNIGLGYVAETPVWRATYRVVLDASDKAVLQAWALVHNDTDEDWKGVRVELVNGRPDSFLFPLAAPRYARRDLVTPEEPLSTVPQLMGKRVDDMWGNMWGDEIGDSFGAGGLGLSGVGEGGGGRGEGIGLGTVGSMGSGESSTLLSIGNLAATEDAKGEESGALFRYSLASPVDLRAHGSALVPFVQQTVSARRIAFFATPGGTARSAARLTNDTSQTLPAGTVAFFADGGFAGEARLDRMKPRDVRFVGFGADLDVELEVLSQQSEDEPQMLVAEDGVLVEHYLRRRKVEYSVKNKNASGRAVVLALDVVANSRVEGADRLDFDQAANRALAIFDADPRSARTRNLTLEEGLVRRHPHASLEAATLRALGAGTKLSPDQRAIARGAADLLAAAQERREALPKLASEIKQAEADAARLRAHVGAARAGTSSELVARLIQEEDRIKAVRGRAALLEVEASDLQRKARAQLERLPRAR